MPGSVSPADQLTSKAMDIAEWLTSKCGIDETHAGMLKTVLEEQYWINSVDGLTARSAIDPNLLQSLDVPVMVKTAISSALHGSTNGADTPGERTLKRNFSQRDRYETRRSGTPAVSPEQTPPGKKQKCVTTTSAITDTMPTVSPPQTPTPAAKKRKCVTTKSTISSLADIMQALTKKGVEEQLRALDCFQQHLKNGADKGSVDDLERVKEVLDTLLVALEQVEDYCEEFVIKVLEVVACALTADHPELQKHAVDEKAVDSLLKLLSSEDVQRRRLALAVLGHLGSGEQKGRIIDRTVVGEVTKTYRLVTDLAAKDQYCLRHSYAEFCQCLISHSTAKHLTAMKPLVKQILLDTIDKQRPSSAVVAAFDAVQGLVTINGATAVEYLAGTGFIRELVSRLNTSSETFLWHTFGMLACMVLNATDKQIPQMEEATPAVARRLSDAALPHTVFAQGALFVAVLCRRGTAAIDRLLTPAPKLLDCLFASLVPTTDCQLRRPLLNPNSANAALALMYIAGRGNATQLAQVLEKGLFVVAFKVLAEFSDSRQLVLQTVQALIRILRSVSKMDVYQGSLADFRADVAWGRIRALINATATAQPNGTDQQQPPPATVLSEHNAQVSDTESALDGQEQDQDQDIDPRTGKAALEASIHKRATALYEAALRLKLVPSTFEP